MSSEWAKLKIEDIADVKSGKRLPLGHTLVNEKTPFPYIRLVDVSNGKIKKNDLKFLMPQTRDTIKRYIVNSQDVCLAIVGHTIGMVFYVDSEWDGTNLTENAARLTAFNENVNSRFLYYYLTSTQGQKEILSRKVGSAQGKLPLYNIKSLEFLAPSRIEQDHIVALLDSLSTRIDLLRETNTTLESIAQALFKSWFVDFDPVHANAGTQEPSLPPEIQSLFPSTFVESPLGLVPEGWDIGSLEDLLVLQRGFDLPSNERTEGNYLIIAASGPSGTHEKAMVKGPGVVTGRSGVLGKVFFTLDDYWPLNTTLWIKEFRRASPCFAFEILNRLDLLSFNAGSAVPSLNRNHIHGLPYLLPPRNLVDEFESTAMLIRQHMAENNKRIESLSALRDTLLPRLISGQLRLPEVEEMLQ